ncbi:hypothetical protein SAMN06295905_1197 [Devosia lucknowensis]|uniref:Uncharacterized protein n=1 Tax=Devosia lucknowensis TaxID=1096929 RepID=A0A1Y6EYK5_9HYPH|nr:hypothetical protein [Devosia lucknowensis]SMQ65323.1 hypothetical protein SAMN06295905_1197 [Devosia lucknowensis]
MTQTIDDPDPYAELDYRADAGELSEDFRKPIRIHRDAQRHQRVTRTRLSANPGRIRI